MKPYLPEKFEVFGCYGSRVSLLQPDYEEEEEEEEEDGQLFVSRYCTHSTSNYIRFLTGVKFDGNIHLDVNKLKLKATCSYSALKLYTSH